MADSRLFTAETLMQAVVDKWGAYGAHAEVMRSLLDQVERLRAAGDALHAAVRNHDLTEAHLKAWEEARRG